MVVIWYLFGYLRANTDMFERAGVRLLVWLLWWVQLGVFIGFGSAVWFRKSHGWCLP
jgi:hypothetical protein